MLYIVSIIRINRYLIYDGVSEKPQVQQIYRQSLIKPQFLSLRDRSTSQFVFRRDVARNVSTFISYEIIKQNGK